MNRIVALVLFTLIYTTSMGQTKPANFDSEIKKKLQLYQKVCNILGNDESSKDDKKIAVANFKKLFNGTGSFVWDDTDPDENDINFVKAGDYFKNINANFIDGHKVSMNIKGAKIGEIVKNYERNSLTCEVKIKKKISYMDIVEAVDSIRIDSTTMDSIVFSHKDTVQQSRMVSLSVFFMFDIENDVMVLPKIYAISKVGTKPKLKPLKGDDKWWVGLSPEWKKYFIGKLKMPEFPDKYDFGKMEYLTKVDLRKETFSEVGPISRLTGLKILNVAGTEVSDLTPLEKLQRLEELDISSSKVTDLSPLSKMKNLKVLKCNKLDLESLDGIKNLTGLIELEIAENKLDNIDALSNFSLLEEVDFSLNLEIVTITPLSGLENLTKVSFAKMKVKDLTPLANCPNLIELNCFNNEITSLAPIRRCFKLTNLNIGYNKIYSLDELNGMKYLIELRMIGAPVEDISVIRNFENIQVLDFSETFITDLSPIMNCEEIQELRCINSKVPKGDIARFKKKYPKCRIYYY